MVETYSLKTGWPMYKFLLVDDEEIVRRGFNKKIAWAEAGFEFLEPCQNGREAIQRIEQEHPDVVMTDICMPLVDGLEVAAYIADRFPEIIVIVLSGYDEFVGIGCEVGNAFGRNRRPSRPARNRQRAGYIAGFGRDARDLQRQKLAKLRCDQGGRGAGLHRTQFRPKKTVR